MNQNVVTAEKSFSKQHTVSGKLLLTLIPMISLAIIALIALVSMQARTIISLQATHGLEQESTANAYSVGNTMLDFKQFVNSTANTLESVDFKDDKEINEFLITNTLHKYDFAENGLYLGFENGTWIDPSGWVPGSDYVITERDWYQQAIEGDITIGEPYVDSDTGSLVVSLSRKIRFTDGRVAVCAIDMLLDQIVSQVAALKPLDTGTSLLLDGDTVLSYTDASFNGTKASQHSEDAFLNAIASAVIAGQSDVIELRDTSGRSSYVSPAEVPGTNWTLVSTVAKDDVLAEMNRFQVVSLIIMVIMIAIIAAVLWTLVQKMVSKPVSALTNTITKIASGDFTVSIAASGNDEIGLMNRSMKDYVDQMHNTLTEIQALSTQLNDESRISQNASEILNEQAKEQSDAMSQITDAMDGMNSAVAELASNATDLAGEVRDLSEQGDSCNATVSLLVSKAQNGQRDMDNVQQGMNTISASMADMASVVDTVNDSAKQITSIIEMISSIAEQTNLLSLNASIEAARAGEAGRGFAVVATEIGQLANESAQSATQIDQIVQDIAAQIQNLSDKSQVNMKEIQTSADAVSTAGATFEEIFRNLDITSTTVTEMISKVSKVDTIATSLAAISEEQSASTEEVTATVENVAQSAVRVADSSHGVDESAATVAESANRISQYIDRFTL
ncbi:MAG: HAMP domain-containing protein [Lachnospiraceae bacterium]|nr:HAMP domain-containing protein [Lachnospiraceae bacterium]